MAKHKFPRIPIDEALQADVTDDVVAINRSAAVVKGGRRFSFSALCVVGNKDGLVGIGYGKGREVPGAIEKSVKDARKQMMRVVREGTRVLIRLDQGPPQHYCRPSVNPMFESVATAYGSAVVAVMLTGMGDDGIEGTELLSRSGAYVIAQDEPTSVVWGMPGAVARAGYADEVLPLREIAPALERACLLEVSTR